MKICIDPGHSGRIEPGACAAGVWEAVLNLTIARKLGECLEQRGYMVLFTRQGEVQDDELQWRAAVANGSGADIFISIHCNAAAGPARGVETYCHPASVAGRTLALAVQRQLAELGYTKDRGVKTANLAVLRWTTMPAILVECGFLTDPADRGRLTSLAGQAEVASAIAAGVVRYGTGNGWADGEV